MGYLILLRFGSCKSKAWTCSNVARLEYETKFKARSHSKGLTDTSIFDQEFPTENKTRSDSTLQYGAIVHCFRFVPEISSASTRSSFAFRSGKLKT